MNILFFDIGAYTRPDIEAYFQESGIPYRLVTYQFNSMHEDSFFSSRFSRFLKEDSYDAVFSVNYFPLVAEACHANNIKYLSWCYDNPLDLMNIERTLGLSTNYVFVFDKQQAKGYREQGFTNVYHLPLAVNTKRLDKIHLTVSEYERYHSEISFVGKLYESQLPAYLSIMDDYCKGYVDAACEAQLKLYGYYLIDDLLSDAFMKRINEHILSLRPDTSFQLPKEALSYAMAAQVTRKERLLLLKLLSSHYQVKLYSREQNPLLNSVKYMGSCGYFHEMPRIFMASDINLNITLKISKTGIPLRVLDILGSGGFLISNWQEELFENFENENDIVLYENIEDAYAKCDFYLRNPQLRKRIAENGYQRVKEKFNYHNQFAILFKQSGLTV